MPDRHTLIIKSETDTLLNGTYEMSIDTIFEKVDYTNDYFITRVHLKSKNKVFDFSRTRTRKELTWPKPKGNRRGSV